jgi:hypothetical protein
MTGDFFVQTGEVSLMSIFDGMMMHQTEASVKKWVTVALAHTPSTTPGLLQNDVRALKKSNTKLRVEA